MVARMWWIAGTHTALRDRTGGVWPVGKLQRIFVDAEVVSQPCKRAKRGDQNEAHDGTQQGLAAGSVQIDPAQHDGDDDTTSQEPSVIACEGRRQERAAHAR